MVETAIVREYSGAVRDLDVDVLPLAFLASQLAVENAPTTLHDEGPDMHLRTSSKSSTANENLRTRLGHQRSNVILYKFGLHVLTHLSSGLGLPELRPRVPTQSRGGAAYHPNSWHGCYNSS